MKAVFGPKDNMADEIINELQLMGIKKLSDFEKIIPMNYKEELKNRLLITGEDTNFCGIVRDVLIIHNSHDYFEKAWQKHWQGTSQRKLDFYSRFGVDTQKFPKLSIIVKE